MRMLKASWGTLAALGARIRARCAPRPGPSLGRFPPALQKRTLKQAGRLACVVLQREIPVPCGPLLDGDPGRANRSLTGDVAHVSPTL